MTPLVKYWKGDVHIEWVNGYQGEWYKAADIDPLLATLQARVKALEEALTRISDAEPRAACWCAEIATAALAMRPT